MCQKLIGVCESDILRGKQDSWTASRTGLFVSLGIHFTRNLLTMHIYFLTMQQAVITFL